MTPRYAVIDWKVSFGAMFHHLSDHTADDMQEFIAANVPNGLQEGELDKAFAQLMEKWQEIDNGGRPRPPTVKAMLWAVKDLRSCKERGAICIGCHNAGWIYDPDAEGYPTGTFVPCDCPAGTKVMYSQFPNADHQALRRKARFLAAQVAPPADPRSWMPRLQAASPAERWEIVCEPDNASDCIRLELAASKLPGGFTKPDFTKLPSPFKPLPREVPTAELERKKNQARQRLRQADPF